MSFNAGTAVGYLDLDTSKFKTGLKGALADLAAAGTKGQSLGQRFDSVGRGLTTIGKGMTLGVTAPIVAGFAASAKSAITFESAFAGVKKTVNASDKELAQLREDILAMSREMPQSASDIAEVAEAAGQLGIETKNIKGFTKNMVMLGDSTNMSSTEAATALARMANITNMSQKDFDRLGSSIVALGNNMATTESEITEMSLRMAGAATNVGFTQDEILALSASLSSVGVQAQAGGGSMSRVLNKMDVDVAANGKALDGWAKVAGMSAKDFAKKWKDDAAGAFDIFVKGLGKVQKEGGNISATLDDLGVSETIATTALTSLAGAEGLLTDALQISGDAWDENTALQKEAAQRYETTESKLKILRNNLVGVGISIGTLLLPYIQKFVDKLQGLVAKFQTLNPQTQAMIIKWGGIAAAIGPALMILGKLTQGLGAVIKGVTAFGRGATMVVGAGIGMVKAFAGVSGAAITQAAAVEGASAATKGMAAGYAIAGAASKVWAAVTSTSIMSIPIIGWIAAAIAAIIALVQMFKKAADVSARTAEAEKKYTDSLKASKQAAIDAKKAADDLNGAKLDAQGAALAVERAQKDYNAAVKEYGKNSLEAREAEHQLKSAKQQQVDATTRVQESEEAANKAKQDAIKANKDQMKASQELQKAKAEEAAFNESATGKFVNGLKTIGATVWEFIQKIPGALATALEAVLGFIGSIPEKLGEFFAFIGSIPGKIWDFLKSIPEKLASIGSQILTFFSELPGKLLAFLQELPYKIGFIIGQVIGFFITLPGKIWTWLQNVIAKIGSWIGSMAAKIREIGPKIITAVVTFFQQLPGKIWTWLVNTVSKIAAWGSNLLSSIKSAVNTAINAAVNFFKTLPGKVLAAIQALPGKILNFFKTLPEKMKAGLDAVKNLGKYIIDGFWNGLKGLAGSIKDKVKGFFSGIVDGVKSVLKIASPSKVFTYIGDMMMKGLGKGLTGKEAKKVKDTAKSLTASLKSVFSSATLGDTSKVKEGLASMYKNLTKTSKSAKKAEANIKSLGTKLTDQAKKMDVVNDKLEKAKEAYANALKEMNDYKDGIRHTISAYADLSKVDFGKDEEGNDIVGSAQKYKESLQQRLEDTRKFYSNMKKLADLGLNQDAIDQIIGMGVEKGLATSSALLTDANKTNIAEINKAMSDIESVGNSMANMLGDKFYLSGVNAAKGIVTGLQKEQAALEAEMEKLAKKLADAFNAYLKIKSPSRMMMESGKNVVLGIVKGIDSESGSVEDAMEGVGSDVDSLAALRGFTGDVKGVFDDLLAYLKTVDERIAEVIDSLILRLNTFMGMGINVLPDGTLIGRNGKFRTPTGNNPEGFGYSGGDTYNFYNPKALTASEQAAQMKRMKRQLELGF